VESRLPIVAVVTNDRMLMFSKRSVFQLAPGDPYYIENALEVLDEPGEWYLDPVAGRVFYMPRPSEELKTLSAIAPLLPTVVRLEGGATNGPRVRGVTFSGIAFSHTEWCFPSGFQTNQSKPTVSPEPTAEVGGFAQAAIGVPGAVWGEGVQNCVFFDCEFSHLGDYGLELTSACCSNRILSCDFFDLGAGGVKLGETRVREPEQQTRGNKILHCDIHDGGKLFASGEGIWVGHSPDNVIAHNEIHDFYYTGISLGWSWGYGPSLATNNVVEFNHVHHIGKKSDGDGPILSDMGGIYTLGLQPGTRIVNNLWHDIAALRYGGWGIYLDEGSSGITVASNVVYRTTHGGFHQHYGETNRVWNNIFALGRDAQVQRTRPEPHSSFNFATNIIYFDNGSLLAGDWSNDNYGMDRNLYFDARPTTPDALRFAGATLEDWRKRGHDAHSIVTDPFFIAPDKGDFRLKTNSPALSLGFQPIDLKGVGREASR
jgi:hypothetical protein